MSSLLPLIGALLGFCVAWAHGKYIMHIQARNRRGAAGWNFLIVLLIQINLISWMESGNHFVLLCYAGGIAFGSYFVIGRAAANGK